MASTARKEKKASKYLDKWFNDPEIKDVFKSNHSKIQKVVYIVCYAKSRFP